MATLMVRLPFDVEADQVSTTTVTHAGQGGRRLLMKALPSSRGRRTLNSPSALGDWLQPAQSAVTDGVVDLGRAAPIAGSAASGRPHALVAFRMGGFTSSRRAGSMVSCSLTGLRMIDVAVSVRTQNLLTTESR